tara:strand:- start:3631 stop:4374 length:744 start_codon:yes stop_codon:yes gene_type:complete
MNYPYNNQNLIDHPEKYMYTKFQGVKLLEAFFLNRNQTLKKLKELKFKNSPSIDVYRGYYAIKSNLINDHSDELKDFFSYLDNEGFKDYYSDIKNITRSKDFNNSINNLSIKQPVKTSILLEILLESILYDQNNIINKVWLDRLVQRFEVTKKIYEEYQAGFRKGRGKNNIIKLYYQFVLILSIYYSQKKKIKYLSTMIKLCDLITSISYVDLENDIPKFGLDLILFSEKIFVQILLKSKGIPNDFR